MIEHGITTTKAAYWAHLHPLDTAVYYYSVQGFRELIARVRLRVKDAHAGTGRGYIIEKEKVARSRLPPGYFDGVDWKGITDREKGLRFGQPIALRVLNEGLLLPGLKRPFWELKDLGSQYKGMDFSNGYLAVEVKTDCTNTENIFVQTHELGHDVNRLPGGGRRYTKKPE